MARSCGCSLRGGFYPSVMGGMLKTGPYFMTAAMVQGVRLVGNNKTRMAKRRSRGSRRRTKRSRR